MPRHVWNASFAIIAANNEESLSPISFEESRGVGNNSICHPLLPSGYSLQNTLLPNTFRRSLWNSSNIVLRSRLVFSNSPYFSSNSFKTIYVSTADVWWPFVCSNSKMNCVPRFLIISKLLKPRSSSRIRDKMLVATIASGSAI